MLSLNVTYDTIRLSSSKVLEHFELGLVVGKTNSWMWDWLYKGVQQLEFYQRNFTKTIVHKRISASLYMNKGT